MAAHVSTKVPTMVESDKTSIIKTPGTLDYNTDSDRLEVVNNSNVFVPVAKDATTVLITPVTTNASFYPVMVSNVSGGNLPLDLGAGFSFNPSTNTLTTTSFVGALTGNASTATALQNARTIGGVSFDGTANIVPQTIQSIDESSDTTCYPLFINDPGSVSAQPKNKAAFTYNASTNTLTATTFSGNATTSSSTTGNAATATALQNARTIGGVSFDGTANIVPQTIQSVNEASDTTCFPLFINDSGSVSDQPKNNIGFTYNASTNALGATTFVGALTGNASTATILQTTRLIGGSSFNGSADIVPSLIFTINESSDTTCFPLFVTDSGTQNTQPKNDTKYTYNASTGNLGVRFLTFSGGSPPSGTQAAISIYSDGSYADGNYINMGAGGRNVGVLGSGNFFHSFNVDYNGTSTFYVYTANGGATMTELSGTTGALRYAVSGTAGANATALDALTWDLSGNVSIATGNLSIGTVGKGLSIKGGSNARIGTGAVLVAGTVTVSTTAVATGDMIFYSCTATGGTQGTPRTSAISNGVSFTITSSNALDTSTYSWMIIRPT